MQFFIANRWLRLGSFALSCLSSTPGQSVAPPFAHEPGAEKGDRSIYRNAEKGDRSIYRKIS
jgi:hypothetical protein